MPKNRPEYLISPCVEYEGGKFLGHSHSPIIERIIRIFKLPNDLKDDPEGTERGFLTNDRNFISREKAFTVAWRSGQVRKSSFSTSLKALYSDDFIPVPNKR